jgi:transglutaminase-like putative cysteine protease
MATAFFLRAIVVLSIMMTPVPSRAADWKPIDQAELALKAPRVQPDADAEALFWEVRVADEFAGSIELEANTIFDHYVRIKIFTDRGREKHATVDIPYLSGTYVTDVAARTIRADGTTLELKKQDIYERTIVKAEGFKVKAVSFAVPGIAPGTIIEYRWRERYRDSLANYLRLPFSRDVPVQAVRYYVRPLAIPGMNLVMNAVPFNAKLTPPERQKDGYSMMSLSNVPADADEPYAAPPWERRPWLFIYYSERSGRSDNFWPQFSKELHESYARRAKPNDEIRQMAAAAVAGASTDGAKIAALMRVVHQRLKRVDVDTADPADRRKSKENRNAADALKRGLGSGDDAVVAFLALASAAGLDARVAAAPNRADLFHKSDHDNPYFVRFRLVAVRSGDGWQFVDPANEHSVSGATRWNLEWEEVLVGDPRQVIGVRTPLSPPAASVKHRTGTFTLLEDGTLEGDCRIVYSGHWNEIVKEEDDQDTPAEREKSYRDVLIERLPGAEVTDLRIENVTDASKDYTAVFRLRVPGFAQKTGTRLILQPAIFQKGIGAVFTAENRSSDVYFPFPWRERDEMTISLPEGFALEQPEQPAPLDANAGRHSLSISVSGGQLVVSRTFEFGVNDAILFPSASYRPIKQFFDLVHARDGHSLILRRKDGAQ